MRRLTIATVAALTLALVCSSAPARAEVSAEIDAFGNYVRMLISADAAAGSSVWAVQRSRPNFRPLNATGFMTGDLYPTVREANDPGRSPWAVWSRRNAGQYDLVFSHWDPVEDAWQPVAMVHPWWTPGSDFSPLLAFDSEHRPYLVWTRSEGRVNRVYLSVWLQSRWMNEYRISDFNENAVATSIRLLSSDQIEVRYETLERRVIRLVSFDRPRTITDDVTPMGHFQVVDTLSTPTYPAFPD